MSRIFIAVCTCIAGALIISTVWSAASPTAATAPMTGSASFPTFGDDGGALAIVVERDRSEAAAAEAVRLSIETDRQAKSQREAQVPQTAPQSVSAPVAVPAGCGYADLIRSIWTSEADWAISIAWRESRCTTTSKSPTGCWGIFQLCVPLHMDIFRYVCPELSASVGNDVALDPECNVRAAWHLFQGAGKRPWAM